MTLPLLRRARPWGPSAEIAVTPVRPLTATGTSLLVVVPLPSEPAKLLPQALTVWLPSSARLKPPPAEIAVTPPSSLTATGVSLQETEEKASEQVSGPLLVPSPSCPDALSPHA